MQALRRNKKNDPADCPGMSPAPRWPQERQGIRMVRRVWVGKGKYALIDDDDAVRVSKVDWRLVQAPTTLYARTSDKRIGKSQQLLHRMVIGAQPGEIVDHINGDGLDNRHANLRVVSAAENAANRFEHERKYTHVDGDQVVTPAVRARPKRCYPPRIMASGRKRIWNLSGR